MNPRAPIKRPTPLAGEPLQPLEYFSLIYTGLLETCWRRGWDSNPRGPQGPNGFQDRPVMTTSVPLLDFQLFKRTGDPSATRTPDTLIKSQVLYRLS